jgi:hypothetical protein
LADDIDWARYGHWTKSVNGACAVAASVRAELVIYGCDFSQLTMFVYDTVERPCTVNTTIG